MLDLEEYRRVASMARTQSQQAAKEHLSVGEVLIPSSYSSYSQKNNIGVRVLFVQLQHTLTHFAFYAYFISSFFSYRDSSPCSARPAASLMERREKGREGKGEGRGGCPRSAFFSKAQEKELPTGLPWQFCITLVYLGRVCEKHRKNIRKRKGVSPNGRR